MNATIEQYLKSFTFGEPQECDNMVVIPLFSDLNGSPEYIALQEAIEKQLLHITEESQQGSVPELLAENEAEIPVILLEGEEIIGAKQNRVLNATILLKERQKTTIPVSCTEAGRWNYVSKEFKDAKFMHSPSFRREKMESVSYSLQMTDEFRSDQGQVWDNIAERAQKANVSSKTGAMKDVFESLDEKLKKIQESFTHLPGQKGVCIFINNTLVGLEYISREPVFKTAFDKLIKGYALDAILDKKEIKTKPNTREAIEKLIEQAAKCEDKSFDSIGYGKDHRFETNDLAGAALVHNDKVIHLEIFTSAENKQKRNLRTGRFTI